MSTEKVITDIRTGVRALTILKEELERRVPILRSDDKEFHKLPFIVCIIDEFQVFTDSLLNETDAESTSKIISFLVEQGRKYKIHMVLASNDFTKKRIECNLSPITARVAFKVDKWSTSQVIIGCTGAESLSGQGAMLFRSIEYSEPINIQGAYILKVHINDRTENWKVIKN